MSAKTADSGNFDYTENPRKPYRGIVIYLTIFPAKNKNISLSLCVTVYGSLQCSSLFWTRECTWKTGQSIERSVACVPPPPPLKKIGESLFPRLTLPDFLRRRGRLYTRVAFRSKITPAMQTWATVSSTGVLIGDTINEETNIVKRAENLLKLPNVGYLPGWVLLEK